MSAMRAIYDSFTITLAILLEEIGLCAARRGRRRAGDGYFDHRRRPAAQHPWRAAQLRPLRRRRGHGASCRGASPDDRPRRPTAGQGCFAGPGCTATAASSPRMSAWSWSRCDEPGPGPTGLDGAAGHPLRALRCLRHGQLLPPRLLPRLRQRRMSDCEARQGEGRLYAITHVTRAPTPELRALAPYAILLVECRGRLSDDGARRPALAIGDPVRAGFRPLRRPARPLFRASP